MKIRFSIVISLLAVFGMLLVACQPAATPAPVAAPTAVPAAPTAMKTLPGTIEYKSMEPAFAVDHEPFKPVVL